MSPTHRPLAAALLITLSACVYSVTPAGPTYLGEGRELARLYAIRLDPTNRGTAEAVNQWSQHPEWDQARDAVLAAIPTATDPLEERFHKLEIRQQRVILAHTASLDGPQVSALVLRLSTAGGLVEDGIAALAGKQDERAVQGLLDLAAAGPDATRELAILALEPPNTPLARDGLLALALATAEPGAIREAALDVLAPYDAPAVREPLLALARDEDCAVAGFAWDRFDRPASEAELHAALTATRHAGTAAAAVRFLDRADTLSDAVVERFVALADTAARPAEPGHIAARYQAARALVLRDDERGGPALVLLLDDTTQRAPSASVLDGWVIRSVPALRAQADALIAPEARAEAARMLARFGGPADQDLVAKLAAPAEREQLLAALAVAPWGIFPGGQARYAPADGVTADTLTHTLVQAIDAGRALRTSNDPLLAYIGAARAYLAGARSTADRDALSTAAAKAQQTFGLWMSSSLPTSTWHGDRIGAIAADTLGARIGVPVRRTAPPGSRGAHPHAWRRRELRRRQPHRAPGPGRVHLQLLGHRTQPRQGRPGAAGQRAALQRPHRHQLHAHLLLLCDGRGLTRVALLV